MIEDHFPDFYRRADRHSIAWQNRYLWSQRTQLGALLAAAAVSAFKDFPFVVVVLFAVAIGAQTYRLVTRADEKWWNGRAGAESAKTASWLYVAGGAPFGRANAKADVELAARLTDIATTNAHLVPVPSAEGYVTPEMAALRARPLADRVRTYRQERIRSQCRWYASKSALSERRGRSWALGALAAQGLALVLGIAAAVEEWRLDFVGLFAAISATALAWTAVKQYEVLARSYAVASSELSAIDVRIGSTAWDEDSWSAFANAAETAISSEHTSWRASRAV